MITRRAPDVMTPVERFAEVAEILASGYLRLLSRTSSQKDLAASREPEAPCGSRATNPKSTESAA